MIFCIACNKNVDTDIDLEHFTEEEECIKSQEIMVNKAEYIELQASHERLKDIMPDLISLAIIGYKVNVKSPRFNLEEIQMDRWVIKTAQLALKQAK